MKNGTDSIFADRATNHTVSISDSIIYRNLTSPNLTLPNLT
jgi:hypothetical protein